MQAINLFQMRTIYLYLVSILLIGLGYISILPPFEGFDETDSGLAYKFFVQNDGKKPKEGDVITLKLKYYNDKDSLLFDSKSIGRPFMVQVPKPSFKGSFDTVLATSMTTTKNRKGIAFWLLRVFLIVAIVF